MAELSQRSSYGMASPWQLDWTDMEHESGLEHCASGSSAYKKHLRVHPGEVAQAREVCRPYRSLLLGKALRLGPFWKKLTPTQKKRQIFFQDRFRALALPHPKLTRKCRFRQVWEEWTKQKEHEEQCATETKEDAAAPALGSATMEETTAMVVVAEVPKGTDVAPAKRKATERRRHRCKSAAVRVYQSPVKKVLQARAARQCQGALGDTDLEVAPGSPKRKDAHEVVAHEAVPPATPLQERGIADSEKESEPALGSLVDTPLRVDSVSDDCCLADLW